MSDQWDEKAKQVIDEIWSNDPDDKRPTAEIIAAAIRARGE